MERESRKNKGYIKDVSNYKVVMHNDFTAYTSNIAKDHNVMVLMYIAISHIHNGDTSNVGDTMFKEVMLPISDLAELMDVKERAARNAVSKADSLRLSLGGENTLQVFEYAYTSNSKVRVKLHTDLTKYLLKISGNYSTFKLDILKRVSSKYVRKLYLHIASNYKISKTQHGVTKDKLVEICGLPKSHGKPSVVQKVIDELNSLGNLHIKYDHRYEVLSW